jgi:hypothetical protein
MTMPTQEQEQRACWDLLLLALEHRAEQVRKLKPFRRLATGNSGDNGIRSSIRGRWNRRRPDGQNLGRLTE